MPIAYPQSTATLFQQPDGTYTAASTGVAGETACAIPITDLVCVDDLDANGAETRSDLQSLAQDLYHVLLQVLGSNPDDEGRGIGASSALSGSSADFARAVQGIDPMIELDPRVQQSTTTQTTNPDGSPLVLISVLPIGSVQPLEYTWSKLAGLSSGWSQ